MQVLIVDDDMATVDVIKNSVKWKELGVSDIFTAYNIRLAKEILKEYNIDIVISDIEMPQGSGIDLLEWFRREETRTDAEATAVELDHVDESATVEQEKRE